MDKLSPAEFKVLMCIVRKTYGWHKDVDSIPLKQIEKMTGLSRKGIVKNLDTLIEHGLLIKIKSKTSDGDDAPNKYTINVNCMGGGSELSTPGVVNSVHHGGSVLSTHSKDTLYTKPTIQNNTPPTPPHLEEEEPACAGGEKVDFSSEESSNKSKKAKPTFSDQVKEITSRMLDLIKKSNPVYRPPSDLSKFMTHVQKMLENEDQDPEILLKTFEWAVSDNEERSGFKGWQSIVVTNNKGGKITNPAEIFHKYFSKIHSQMNSRPKRKFAASSDQEAAMKCMEDMNSRAII